MSHTQEPCRQCGQPTKKAAAKYCSPKCSQVASRGRTPWNGGTSKGWVNGRGYRYIYVQERGRKRAKLLHRHLMEQRLGRRLEPWEVVHHKDGNPQNNDISNLVVTTHSAHSIAHVTGIKRSRSTRRTCAVFANFREELKRERAMNALLLKACERLLLSSGCSCDEGDPKFVCGSCKAHAAIAAAREKS